MWQGHGRQQLGQREQECVLLGAWWSLVEEQLLEALVSVESVQVSYHFRMKFCAIDMVWVSEKI